MKELPMTKYPKKGQEETKRPERQVVCLQQWWDNSQKYKWVNEL